MLKQELNGAVSTRFFIPSAELSPYISTIYQTEFALQPGEVVRDWLHPEWANVRMADTPAWSSGIGGAEFQPLARIIATGPTSLATHFKVDGPMRSWGIGLLPLGWLRLLDAPANQYCDATTECVANTPFAHFAKLHELVFRGPNDPAAQAKLIEGFLVDLLSQRPRQEEESRVHAAHTTLIDDDVRSVSELAERLGVSSRSLERLSLRAFGFSPKLLLRRQRFLRSLAQFMLDPSLTWIKTLDWHYVDQAHFVRDFRRFMTMSPSEYAAQEHPVLRSAARARAVAMGAAVQALHQP